MPAEESMGRKFAFIGVSTTESAVNKFFSTWAALLDQPWQLEHMDADPGDNQRLQHYVHTIRENAEYVGALVTTHKASVYEIGSELGLEELEPAGSLREVGFLDKPKNCLRMRVSDVDSQKPVMRRLVGNPNVKGGEFLVLGAGGAGLAFAWNAAVESIGIPQRVRLIESNESRVLSAQRIINQWNTNCPVIVDYNTLSDAIEDVSRNNELVTFIVNASGEGKDRISSRCDVRGFSGRPLTYWDFNYRGSLDLLRAFQSFLDDEIITEDGLEYFYNGWSVVMCAVADYQWDENVAIAFGVAAKEMTESQQ